MQSAQVLPSIRELVSAGLVVHLGDDEYSFRHTLTRDVAYASMLLRERKRYHGLIAVSLSQAQPSDQLLADLAYHSYEAGAWAEAQNYARQAGERAQARYAPREAVEHLSRALESARALGAAPPPGLLRGRGQAFETLGDFQAAQTDYEQELELARTRQDGTAEWQALIDLGFLWASRDYGRTGEYFTQALERARALGEPRLVARSLNRVGNFYANVDRPAEGVSYHRESLAILEREDDPTGVAETLDLLGMASMLESDQLQATVFYRRAIALYERMDDRRGLAGALAGLSLCAAVFVNDLTAPGISLEEGIELGERAIQLANEIGWRAGESYARVVTAGLLLAQGRYDRASELAEESLAISRQIEHQQWQVASLCALGAIGCSLYLYSQARSNLEAAMELAQSIQSGVWIGEVGRYLVHCYLALDQPEAAEAVLDWLPLDAPADTQTHRNGWQARAEIDLYKSEPAPALEIASRLIASAQLQAGSPVVIPALCKLRGDALFALGRAGEAIGSYAKGIRAAEEQGQLPLAWRLHAALGQVHQHLLRPRKAQGEFNAANTILAQLAAKIPDRALPGTEGSLRTCFLAGAESEFPGLAQRRERKRRPGG